MSLPLRLWSIPFHGGSSDITFDLELTLKPADQISVVSVHGHELSNRLPVFGNQDSVRSYTIEQSQALFLEFGGGECFHDRTLNQPRQKSSMNTGHGLLERLRLSKCCHLPRF
jgi:hypothetical protein